MNIQGLSKPQTLFKTNLMVLAVFAFFLLTKFIRVFPLDVSQGLAYWTYTDWLVDYSAGFVRRGLSGELIDFLSTYVHPQTVVAILAWIIFVGVVLGYVRLLSRSIKTLPAFLFAALLFLPSLLPFYLYEHDAFGRKEIIGYLLLLYHLYALEAAKPVAPGVSFRQDPYVKRILPLTFLFIPIHILVHESSFLLFLPVHVLITYTSLRSRFSAGIRPQIFRLLLLYLPALVTFAVVFLWGRPEFETAYNICRKWQLADALGGQVCRATGNPMRALPGSLSALPWTFSQAISIPLSFTPPMVLAWFVNFLLVGSVTIYVGRMTAGFLRPQTALQTAELEAPHTYARAMSYKYFLLPLLLSAPLYILGWDIGRWFAVTCLNYVMLSLSPELHGAENQRVIKAKTVTRLRYGLLLIVSGVILFTGIYPDWIGLSRDNVIATPLLVLGGIILLAFVLGQGYEKYLARNPEFARGAFPYVLNVLFLLGIIISLRMPYCCEHDGWKMLAEPVQLLIKNMIN